jgi:hypothetical protein
MGRMQATCKLCENIHNNLQCCVTKELHVVIQQQETYLPLTLRLNLVMGQMLMTNEGQEGER